MSGVTDGAGEEKAGAVGRRVIVAIIPVVAKRHRSLPCRQRWSLPMHNPRLHSGQRPKSLRRGSDASLAATAPSMLTAATTARPVSPASAARVTTPRPPMRNRGKNVALARGGRSASLSRSESASSAWAATFRPSCADRPEARPADGTEAPNPLWPR